MLMLWIQEAVQKAAAEAGNSSGIDCKWLLVGACTPLAIVIGALWRALEKSNTGRLDDLKDTYKSAKKSD